MGVSDDAWLLWVDGVGGYLVCLSDAVTLGQAFADPPADVPILADVSRRHAVLQRAGEGYWLETPTANGPPERKALRSGDRIALGATCQFAFALPEPLSASARLDPASGHRFGDPVDAVLLMAETVVLGPGAQAHVAVPDWTHRVVLHRRPGGLALKAHGAIRVGEQTLRDRADLPPGVPATIADVTLTAEPRVARPGP